jgi:hypothetical protein
MEFPEICTFTVRDPTTDLWAIFIAVEGHDLITCDVGYETQDEAMAVIHAIMAKANDVLLSEGFEFELQPESSDR